MFSFTIARVLFSWNFDATSVMKLRVKNHLCLAYPDKRRSPYVSGATKRWKLYAGSGKALGNGNN